MSERKVLNKYYPPDYDASKVPRIKRKNKLNDVRTMPNINLKCNTCGNHIAADKKFNAKKESVEDETYNNLKIFRFYIKCPSCMATIILRTNLKEKGYEVEHGATENFKALKMAERQAQEEAKAEEEEEKINPMKHLENRTKASRLQMEASEQIQNLRSIKFRHHAVDLDAIIQTKRLDSFREQEMANSSTLDEEDNAIREEAKKLLKRKAIESQPTEINRSNPSSFKSSDKLKPCSSGGSSKISSSLANLKKKIKVMPKLVTDSDATNKS